VPRAPWIAALAGTLLVQTIGTFLSQTVPVVAPRMTAELGLPPETVGNFASVNTLGAILFLLFGTPLVAALGPARLLQWGVLTGAFALGLAASGAVWALPVAALLMGIGYGPTGPAGSRILQATAPPRHRVLIFSVKQAGAPAGGALAGLIAAPIAAAWGWQAALWFGIAAGILAALALQPLRATLDVERGPRVPLRQAFTLRRLGAPVAALRMHPALPPLTLQAFAFAALQGCLFNFTVTWLVEAHGATLTAAGTVYAVMQACWRRRAAGARLGGGPAGGCDAQPGGARPGRGGADRAVRPGRARRRLGAGAAARLPLRLHCGVVERDLPGGGRAAGTGRPGRRGILRRDHAVLPGLPGGAHCLRGRGRRDRRLAAALPGRLPASGGRLGAGHRLAWRGVGCAWRRGALDAPGLGEGRSMAVALGIVGFGIMGERLLRAALAHDPAVIRPSGIWDPDPEAAARLAAIAPDLPMLPSAEAVIAGCDALYVASPPGSHIAHAEAAFTAGKAAFLEKPLASDLDAARRFVAAAEQAGARAAVNFPMASSPAVAQLSAWRAGMGAPRALSIQLGFRTWPRGWQQAAAGWLARREEGGFTREVLSHFLFLTLRQLGPITVESRSATFPKGDGPDDDGSETAIRARLRAGGITAEVAGAVGITEADDENEWRLTLEGGAIRLRDWSFAERQAVDIGWHAAPEALPNEKMRPLVLKGQLDKLAALTRGEPQDLATLREALAVQEVVEAILAG
jgi:predicted dehydrogenase/MFS family permease